uniref:Phosphoinositide interacting regulator of transient receptor potential channels n=1 Tax=Astyanax mexicanus TaxID=7994 RepID=A0A8B9KNP7_ASTMX
ELLNSNESLELGSMNCYVEDPQTDLKTVKSFQSPLFPAEDSGPVERPLWSHYHKPIFVLVIGGLVLCTGVALSLVSSEKNSVPQVLGPVFLSIGLMFILVAVVWFPIIKDKLKRKGLKTQMESFDED